MSTVSRLLFVCAGNICRGPTAEALLRHVAKSRPALETLVVGSAGTIALSGNLPCADAVDVMRRQFELEIGDRVVAETESGPREGRVVIPPGRVTFSELRGPLAHILSLVEAD